MTVQRTVDGSAAVDNPLESTVVSESTLKRRSRDRQLFTPEPVMVTVFWWQPDNGRTACMENQFSPAAATPLRFRCLGTNSTKYPKRFRVDLAQALDSMPELDRRELKALGGAIATTLSRQLGVEVAACSPGVIDTVLGGV